MKIEVLAIPDVKVLTPDTFGDDRGFFSETYNQKRLAEEAGISEAFVQDNHSLSRDVGVIRGLHFQSPPFAQGKLVRVVKGAILDVALDIRKDSPTFGQHVAAEISAENWSQIWVPPGFAHGFCTLMPDTEVIYKVTNFYSPEHDHGVLWNDPTLKIAWPASAKDAILSEKDKKHPLLSDLPHYF